MAAGRTEESVPAGAGTRAVCGTIKRESGFHCLEEGTIIMFVANRMSKNPITITPDTTVTKAAAIMKAHKINRLPVLEGGKLVGLVSDGDISRVSPSPATTLSQYEISSLLDTLMVKNIMSKRVIAINAEATIEEAAYLMERNNISGLPVVSDMGAVVGVITARDILRAFVNMMGLADGKTRISLYVHDRQGAMEDISGVLAKDGVNIDSLVTYKENESEYEIVIRGDFPDLPLATKHLEEHGYKVAHTVEIR